MAAHDLSTLVTQTLALDDPLRALLASFDVRAVVSADDADFHEGYAALEAEFAARGELERRDVVEGWLRRDASLPDGARRYFFVVVRTRRGALAAVRDCHVIVDARRRTAVVYLAHVLVHPEHRRGGLGALLRAVPGAIGRRAATALGAGTTSPRLLLVAEMERWLADDPATRARLVAYGRAGFAAIAPSSLDYAQPDFRAPEAIGSAPRPVPLLLIVSVQPPLESAALPRALAEAAVEALYGVFATHCDAEHLRGAHARAMASLRALPDPIPLVHLPVIADDTAALEALAGTG